MIVVTIANERDREFRSCEICGWMCLCFGIRRGSKVQPAMTLETVPDRIWLCNECQKRSDELWQWRPTK